MIVKLPQTPQDFTTEFVNHVIASGAPARRSPSRVRSGRPGSTRYRLSSTGASVYLDYADQDLHCWWGSTHIEPAQLIHHLGDVSRQAIRAICARHGIPSPV